MNYHQKFPTDSAPTSSDLVAQVEVLRRERWTGRRTAQATD